MTPSRRTTSAFALHGHRIAAIAGAIACLALLSPDRAESGWRKIVPTLDVSARRAGFVPAFHEFGSVPAQDAEGNFWFGSVVYDGVRWWRDAHAETLGESAGDGAGNIWFVNVGGIVHRFDGTRWHDYPGRNPAITGLPETFVAKPDGHLWVETPTGIARFNGSSWENLETALFGDPRILLEDRDGNLWVQGETYHGRLVARFDGRNWATYPELVAGGLGVMACLQDRRGDIWFATAPRPGDPEGELVVLTPNGFVSRKPPSSDGYGTFVGLAEDSTGGVWAAFGSTTPRISRWEPRNGKWREFSDGTLGVWGSIWVESTGALWWGSVGNVYARFDGEYQQYVPVPITISNLPAVMEDHEGYIWLPDGAGVFRFDGYQSTRFWHLEHLMGVRDMLEDRHHDRWFMHQNALVRFDGDTTWSEVGWEQGAPVEYGFYCMVESDDGSIWLGGTVPYSVLRLHGGAWTIYGSEELALEDYVWWIEQARDGSIWCGGWQGIRRFDGVRWENPFEGDSISGAYKAVLDTSGNWWFASNLGLTRFDGEHWKVVWRVGIRTLMADREGAVWASDANGVVRRFEGDADVTARGVPGPVFQDRFGSFWTSGPIRFDLDRIPPVTRVLSAPSRVLPSRSANATYASAYGESFEASYSHRYDGGPWSPWTTFGGQIGEWRGEDLEDGDHVLELRSRDEIGNIDPSPAIVRFEVDATPPAPIIAEPAFDQPVRGRASVSGTAGDARFLRYVLEVRPSGTTTWDDADSLAESATPVEGGALASWDTSTYPDGAYDLRLSVADTLGLVGFAQITVIVDNEAPFADVTSPVTISAAGGGDAFTTGAESHLYFPPHAFAEDARVTITANALETVPAALPSGATRILPGYALAWASPLLKPARFELSVASAPETGALAIWFSADGATWTRLGGTLESDPRRLALTVTHSGRYAVFAESTTPNGSMELGSLAFTPRVFSPSGHFADREVGIGFTLGRAAPVTVRVYSRSGRLIREVAAHRAFGPGKQMVRWDGKGEDGVIVTDGAYVVTVEALGRIERKALAVVR